MMRRYAVILRQSPAILLLANCNKQEDELPSQPPGPKKMRIGARCQDKVAGQPQ